MSKVQTSSYTALRRCLLVSIAGSNLLMPLPVPVPAAAPVTTWAVRGQLARGEPLTGRHANLLGSQLEPLPGIWQVMAFS